MSWEAGLPAERGRGSRLGRGAAASVPLGTRAFPAVTPQEGPPSVRIRQRGSWSDGPCSASPGSHGHGPQLLLLPCWAPSGRSSHCALRPGARPPPPRPRPTGTAAPASCSFPSSALTLPRKASASLGNLCRVPHCTAAASRRGPSRVTAASPAPRVRNARFRGGAALDHVPAAAGALAGVRELEWETSYIFVSTTFCKG